MKSNFRVWFIALLGMFVFGITDAYAGGTAYSRARAYLKEGSPTAAGKVYVSTSSSTPAASSYKNCTSSTTAASSAQVKGASTTTTYHFWAQANAGYKFTGWYSKNASGVYTSVSSNAHYSVSVTSNAAPSSGEDYKDMDLYAEFLKLIQLSFIEPTNGTYDITHKGAAVANYASFTVDGPVKLTAHPAAGYKLRGWYTSTNGGVTKKYFAFGTTCEPNNLTADATIGADFVLDDGKATFWPKGSSSVYDDLNAAVTATSDGGIIVVVSDGTLPAGNYTINKNITLLLPYSTTNNKMTEPNIVHVTAAGSAPALSVYRKLTLAPGANITVNSGSSICLGGSIASVNGGNASSFPCGPSGVLDLSQGGSVTLKSGATLYAWGFVQGQNMDQGNNTSGVGRIIAKSGSTVWEDYQVGDWRGGTASSSIYSSRSSWKFFPFQSWTIQNIEAPIEFQKGATGKGFWTIFGDGQVFTVKFDYLASSGSLFTLNDAGSTLEKWYDPTTDKVCYQLGGGATTLDAMTLTAMGTTITTNDYNLPVPCNMSILLKSGTFTVSKPVVMHAGASMEDQSGATFNVNTSVYMFDQSEWGKYCMYYGGSDVYFQKFNTLTKHYDRGDRTSKTNLTDASILVDGTLVVTSSGKLYSTASGCQVTGNNGGVVRFAGSLPSSTSITMCTNLKNTNSVSMANVNLQNDNGTYTKVKSSSYFDNVNGRWFIRSAKNAKADHTWDFTYISSGAKNGTGGTDATVSAVYSNDRTGDVDRMKWFNVTADECEDWWVGPSSYLYNWTLNDEWHQFIPTGGGMYSGSDGVLHQKGADCEWDVPDYPQEGCFYNVEGTLKALVGAELIEVEANSPDDHAWHKKGAASTYYICLSGCIWKAATRIAGYSQAYATNSGTKKYIWYGDEWLEATEDAPYFCARIDNKLKYFEWNGSAWTIMDPVAEVTISGETTEYIRFSDVMTAINGATANPTVRLLKNINLTSGVTYSNNKQVTFNLNGYTISGAVNNLLTVNNASAIFIVIDGSTGGTGKIDMTFSKSDGRSTAINVVAGRLILNSGKIHAENTHASQPTCAIELANGTTFTQNGGRVEAASKADTWGIHTASGSTTAQVNINGGVDSVSTTATNLVVSAIMSEGGKVNMSGGTIKVSAIDSKGWQGGTAGIRLNHANSRLAMNGGTIIANAKAYARGIYITSSSAKDTINGGVIRSVADSVCAFGIQTYGQTIVNDIDMDVTGKGWGTYGINNTVSGSKLLVNGGRFNIHNTASSRVVGVYSDNGNDTINGGEFTITSKNKEAYGFYLKNTIESFVVNGGKFKVTGNNGADTTSTYAAIWAEEGGDTSTKFKIAGGYYNMTSNLGARTADGKGVFALDPEVEGDLIENGYIRKVRGVEYTITWKNRGGKETLATTKVENGKIPVYPGETPTYSSSSGVYRFIGWNTEDKQTSTIPLSAATGNATYYATYENIYAEVIADGITTQYTTYSSAWSAAMAKQQATIRLLRNRPTVNTLHFNPSNANSIITLDLNGYAWGQDGSNHPELNQVLNANPTQANCKLIITDNSASGKGYIHAGWAKGSELMAMYVRNCEVVMEGGTIKCYNSYKTGQNAIGVKVHSTGKFTMLGGAIEAEIPDTVTGTSNYAYGVYNEGYVDLDSCTIKAINRGAGRAQGVSVVANSQMARLGKVDMQVQGNNTCFAVYAQDTVQIDGGQYSVTAGSSGYAIWATNTNAFVTIDGGTFNTKVTSGNGAYGIYSDANATITVNNGTFKDSLSYASGIQCFAVYAGANGTININGGEFNTIPAKTGDDNNNCVRITGLNSKLNITGGRFYTTGYAALRSFCGTTMISGDPVFIGQRCVQVGTWPGAEGTNTAKVTIDGGTFVATGAYTVLYSSTATSGTKTVIGDLEVLDGKFFSSTSTYPLDPYGNVSYLKVHGGYFSTYISSNIGNLTRYVIAPSVTEACDTTIDERHYTYHVKNIHAITWHDGTSNIRIDNVLRNEMPSFGEEVPSHPSPGTATYDFAGWQNLVTGDTVVKATEDVTYTAQWRKIEAEVIEGEAAGVRFEHFKDAFDYAKDLSNATVKVLSDVTMEAPIRMDTAATITLDLNGHTLEYTGGTAIAMDSVSTLIITDSRTGGKIWTHSATPEWLFCAEINKGELRLEGGELYARNTKTSNGKARAVIAKANTTFTMTGGTLRAVSTIDARGVVNSGANVMINISGGTVIANTYISETYGNNAYGIYLSDGEAHISGNPTFTVDANTYAYGVYIDGTGTTVDVDGNSAFNVTTHGSETNSYAYGFRVGASCALSVSGGTFTIRVPGGKKECYGVNVAGTVNIAGGTFDINDQTSGGDNIDVIRATAATSVVNITGGTFNSRYNGMRAMGGTTTISGNPIFNNSQCVLAAYYSGVNGTAYVTIYGGTFNATSNYPINASWRSPSAGVVANSDIKVYGGYFQGSGNYTAFKYQDGAGTASLTFYGGYYKGHLINHENKAWESWNKDGYNCLGMSTTEVAVPNPSDEYTAGYRYQLKTNYTITWVYGDASENETYISGSMPSKALTTYTSGGKTYYFTGWSPEIAVVSGNATYTAQGIAYEAEVIVGLDTTRYTTFADAWDYALAQDTATVRLLNTVETSDQINYAPTIENGRHALDLNNCTITHTGTGRTFLVLNRADARLTITDNSGVKGGKIVLNPAGGANGLLLAASVSSGELVLAGGELFVQNTYTGKDARGVTVSAGATFTMTDGTIRAIAKTNARGINIGTACTINIRGGHIIASTETPADTWGATAYGIILWGNGTANISGSPVIDVDAASSAVGICTSGEPTTVTITGGTFNIRAHTGNNATCFLAQNSSTITVGGVTVNTHSAAQSPYVANAEGGRIDITGGSYTIRTDNASADNLDIICVRNHGTLNISGGTFSTYDTYSGGSAIRAFGGTTTVSGSPEFTARGGISAANWCSDTGSEQWTATVVVNGGTFNTGAGNAISASWANGAGGNVVSSDITINGGHFMSTSGNMCYKRTNDTGTATLTINGGYFNETSASTIKNQLSNYLGIAKWVIDLEADDPEYTAGYRYTIDENMAVKVVVGEATTYYATIKLALDFAKTQANPEITLLQNVSFAEPYTLYPTVANWRGTLDLNNFTLTGTHSSNRFFSKQRADAVFTITDNSEEKEGVLNLTGDIDSWLLGIVIDAGELVLAGGTIHVENTHSGRNIEGINIQSAGTFTQTGGKLEVTSPSSPIGVDIIGSATVSGGEIEVNTTGSSAKAFHMKTNAASILAVSGGTFNVSGGNNSYGVYQDIAGATATISGGTFNVSGASNSFGIYQNANGATATISGSPAFDVRTTGATAYGIRTFGSGSTVVIGGTPTVLATAGATTTSCVVATSSGHATINGGTFNGYAAGNAPNVVYASGGRVDITGGEFMLRTNDGTSNIDIIRVDHNSTLNISGGTFSTYAEYTKGSAIRAFGGTTTISGTPTFAAYQGVLAADYFGAVSENREATVTINGGTFDVRNYAIQASWYKSSAGDYYLTSDITVNGGKFKTSGSVLIYKTADGTASSSLAVNGGYFSKNTTNLASYVTANHTLVALTAAEKAVIGSDYNWQVTDEGGTSGPLDIVDYSATSVTLNMNGYVSTASQAGWKVKAYGNTYDKTDRAADRTLVVDISSASLSADDTIRIDGTASDGTTVESHYLYIMPHIFTENTTLNPASVKATSVLYVKSDTLTINADVRVNKVYVCADAMLVIDEDATLTVDTLVLRTKPFHSAELLNNGTLSATKVYYTRQIANKSTYYEIALPYDVTLANVRFSNGKPATYGSHYGLMEYSGQSRANNGPNTSLNWQTLNPASVTTMSGKKAYEMISASAYYYEFYFPVTYSKRDDEATVAVTAYARAEGETPKGDKGWNYITTPYTHTFECDYGESPEDGLKIAWRAEDNTSFNQDVATAIKPTQAFYYQTETTGSLDFSSTNFHFAAMPRRAAQSLSTQWIRLHYSEDAEGASADVTNIYLNDEKFTSAYETGYDVAKWSLDGGQPLIWTVVGSYKLAFAALPDSVATNSIPLTVFNPTEGTFTFSLELNRYMKRLEHVYLWDTYTNTTVDLMEEDYTETLGAGTIEGRFFLYTRNVPAVTTDIDLINGGGADADSAQPRKVIIEDKVFIIRGEHIYSIDGQLVK